jgi:hypothetical protein
MIESGIQEGVRDKICMLPPLVRDFVREKVSHLWSIELSTAFSV